MFKIEVTVDKNRMFWRHSITMNLRLLKHRSTCNIVFLLAILVDPKFVLKVVYHTRVYNYARNTLQDYYKQLPKYLI